MVEPDLGFKPLLAKLRAQQPDLGAATKEVREAAAGVEALAEDIYDILGEDVVMICFDAALRDVLTPLKYGFRLPFGGKGADDSECTAVSSA